MLAELRAGERAIVVGLPGSGKSNLMMWLAEMLTSVVIIDSKRDPAEWAAWGRPRGYAIGEDPELIARHPLVIHQVGQPSLDDRAGWRKPGQPGHRWTRALEAILARGASLVIWDEVLQTMPAGQAHPLARQIYTQGRSRGLGSWAGTQVGNRMDTLVSRLAEHAFAFATINANDLRHLQDARGVDPAPLTTLDAGAHQFAYHRLLAPSWRVSGPAPLAQRADRR